MQELKATEKKKFEAEITYIAEVGFINAPNPLLSPLFSFFAFNPSFSILPDVISNNTPVPFFIISLYPSY